MIQQYGWNPSKQFLADQQFGTDAVIARVISESRTQYEVVSRAGFHAAQCAGSLQHHADNRLELPTVGDWVKLRCEPNTDDMTIIEAVLERTSVFVRKQAGPSEQPQPIAANIDTLFIVSGFDHDLNASRIERYVAQAWQSGATPVLVMTKADIREDWSEQLNRIQQRLQSVECIGISSMSGIGISNLNTYLQAGKTVALVGSSGAGKSTLLNHLAGKQLAATSAVRSDDSKGRHTTTSRNLYMLPTGAMILDTPGMRELGLWGVDADEVGFEDIEQMAAYCRFADCKHLNEPGCAVKKAVDNGDIDPSRLQNYHRLQREAEYHQRKQNLSAQGVERAKWKSIHKAARNLQKG